MAPTKPRRSRKRAPSKAEWDRIKKPWHQLYIREKLPLSEVSERLARDHNFEAGRLSMFKTRMKNLGTRKNFKKEELGAVANVLGIFVQAGLRTPTAIIDGQPVPIQRVKRHFSYLFPRDTLLNSKTAGSFPQTAYLHSLTGPLNQNHGTEAERSGQVLTMPTILLKQSEDMHDLELTLIQLNNYYAWRLQQSEDYFRQQVSRAGHYVEPDRPYIGQLSESIVVIRRALIHGGLRVGQAAMRDFCTRAAASLREQHPVLPTILVRNGLNHAGGTISQGICEINSCLLILAKRLLQPNHPISMILKVIQNSKAQHMPSRLLLNVCYDVARRQLEHDSGLVFQLDHGMTRTTASRADFETASQCWLSLLQRTGDKVGQKHVYYRTVLYEIGQLNYLHGLDESASKILLQSLELDDQPTQGNSASLWITASSMLLLADICEVAEDLSGAEEWYLKAYNIACQVCGPEHHDSLDILYHLDRVRAISKGEGATVSEVGDAEDEDVLDQLQMELRLKLHAEPWNDWDNDASGVESNASLSDREDIEEGVTAIDKTLNQDAHQNSHQIFHHPSEATDSFKNPPVIQSSWDIENDLESWAEHESSEHAEGLEVAPQDGDFEAFDQNELGSMSKWLTDAHGVSDGTLPTFVPEDLALPLSLPENGQDFATTMPYTEALLPTLGNDIEFQEFDNVGSTNCNFDTDPMILDPEGDLSTFDLGFFNDIDLQAYDAIQDQDQDVHEGQDFFTF
ncbi:hypothetical protein AYO20_10514 [Fonsecaea nubica]|uniref:Clr5 domain-containing protein n=1 Tax=Fonsecaea nubica TaxID=856822 RepID=A0A178C7J9_9EURO|nr:hypothetical protein AYO20_10514 [Fonsecaea nubica]OAL25404.1 hypothetical protein AYO20_10514 [Fonsecaea nubica]